MSLIRKNKSRGSTQQSQKFGFLGQVNLVVCCDKESIGDENEKWEIIYLLELFCVHTELYIDDTDECLLA